LLFPNSIASNDIDFISESDSSLLAELKFIGNDRRELADKRTDILFDDSRKEATHYAKMLLGPVGKLPMLMRKKLAHIVILKGNESAFAEDKGHFFSIYSENIDIRYENNDLEETVFHESVYATLDEIYAGSEVWLSAQRSDNGFITNYAERNPNKEDLAESALFAYTYLKFPDRLPAYVITWMENMMPNRLEFLRDKRLARASSCSAIPRCSVSTRRPSIEIAPFSAFSGK